MDKYLKQQIPSFTPVIGAARRKLPLKVIISVLFSNIFGYLGLSFSILGSVFCIVFTPMVDFISPFYFGDSSLKARGIVTEVNSTNTSVNDERVIEYVFTFSYMGRTYNGVSYSTDHSYIADDSVPVEFEPDNPDISRIEDMSVKPFSMAVLFVYIFPAIGFVFLFLSIKKGIPKLKAISSGIMTRGKFIKMEATGGSINNRVVYDLFFSFRDTAGNEHTATGSTHITGPATDETEERIIYDPENPSNSVVVDAMPSTVRKYLSSIPG